MPGKSWKEALVLDNPGKVLENGSISPRIWLCRVRVIKQVQVFVFCELITMFLQTAFIHSLAYSLIQQVTSALLGIAYNVAKMVYVQLLHIKSCWRT